MHEQRGWLLVSWFVALLLALFAALAFFANLKLKNELAVLRDDNRGLRDEVTAKSKQLEQVSTTLGLLQSPEATHVSLASGVAQSKPHGKAIYSKERGRLILIASNLRDLPPRKTYELWLVPMRGSPIAAGVFKPDSKGNVLMTDLTVQPGVEAKAFAISVEEESGATLPTMPLIMVGTAAR